MAYWEAVNELIQPEPVEERDHFLYAMLAGRGIETGKPFAPDNRRRKLLEDDALLGEEISKHGWLVFCLQRWSRPDPHSIATQLRQ